MILILYNKNYLKISGHACYSTKGKDIVCAGVSAIIFGALSWFNNQNAKIKIDKNEIIIKLLKKTKKLQDLINLIVKQLNVVQNKYKKNIKIIKYNESKI